MLTLPQTLPYYKRKDVQKLLLDYAQNKEIAARFNDFFGKRPDALSYENDIMEFAKQGVTSFHCSEEIWQNPQQLNPNLKRKELDEMRIGWDLILDIDCPYWSFSKLTAYLFIKALKDHKINCVTVKFSGSKGFHIAVPFEAFPKKINNIETKTLFPEGPRKLAEYLLYYINKNLINPQEDKIIFGKIKVPYKKLMEDTGKLKEDFIKIKCEKCNREISEKQKNKLEFVCPLCETRVFEQTDTDKTFMTCPKCKKIMEKHEIKKSLCLCGSNKVKRVFDISSIVAVDTILISSRHLYRMPYSLHEKTGFVSVPFDIKHILNFEKKEADVKNFKPYKYMKRDEAKPGEASFLFEKAFEFTSEKIKEQNAEITKKFTRNKTQITSENLNAIEEVVPEELFPPCIKKISAGLEDGKKRAVFILANFLSSCNWDHDKIEEWITNWNERNPEPLKEVYIKGQLRYHKQQKEKILPPNCGNTGYFKDLGFCIPDNLCQRIKNPVQYAKRKSFLMREEKPKRRKKEDKE